MVHAALPIEYVTYQNELDSDPTYVTGTWGDLVGELTQHDLTDCDPCPGGKQCKAKFGMALSPGIPREDTDRHDKNVERVTFLMLDFDHLTQKEAEGVDAKLAGLELVAHSTHSHRHGLPATESTPARPPDEDICFRVALPYSRPLAPAEHKKVRAAFIEKYGLRWARPLSQGQAKPEIAGADNARKDLSGIYFFPSAPKSQEPYLVSGHQEGTLFDIDELLNAAPVTRDLLPVEPVLPSIPVVSGPVNLEEICKLLRGYNPRKRPEDEGEVISKKELVRRVSRFEPLVRPEEVGQRDHSCNRIGFILGRKFSEQIGSEEVLLELVRASVRALPVYPDDDPSPDKDGMEGRFAKVVRGWNNGRAAFEAQKKERADRKAERKKTHQEMYAEKFPARFGKDRDAAAKDDDDSGDDEDGDSEGEGGDDGGDGPDWEKLLLRMPAKDGEGEGALQRAGSNAALILRNDPEWKGNLRWNEVTKDVVIGEAAPLEEFERSVSAVTTGIGNWMQIAHGLILSENIMQAQIFHIARSNAFDPLKDYLNGVRLDRTKRIDTFLEVYCGAMTKDPSGKDITDLVRKISRRWLIGCVARGLKPGCQMDNVLILEGAQGIKKSRFLRALAGEFFADSTLNVTDKDSKLLAAQSWIIELSELSSLRPNETEAQKGFFSSPSDKFRPPYGRAIETFLRRCVFVGTTNDHKYLYDATGNRRPWPVRCSALDARRVKKDRDLIWAEAVAEYRAGLTCPDCIASNDDVNSAKEEDRCEKHRWWFSLEENKVLEEQNNQRLRSGFAEVIYGWLLSFTPEKRPKEVTMLMVANDALKLPPDKMESQYKPIGLALKALDIIHKQRTVQGKHEYFYAVPEALLRLPKRAGGKGGLLYAVPDLPAEEHKK